MAMTMEKSKTGKKSPRRAVARTAAALALAGAVAAVAPQVASASEYIDPCDLSKKITELQGWGSDTSNNIMVYKATARQSSWFNDVVTQGTASVQPCGNVWPTKHDYHWVVFKGDGEFVRKGDGGYRNWAYYGSLTRNDTVVRFHRR